MSEDQRQALARDIARRLQLASLDEVRVLDRLLVRIELGRERYGRLDLAKPRDWRRELGDELLDAVVYDTFEQVRQADIDRSPLHAAVLAELHDRATGLVIGPTAALVDDLGNAFTADELARWVTPDPEAA